MTEKLIKKKQSVFYWPLKNRLGYLLIILLLSLVAGLGKCSAETSFQKAYKYIQQHEGNYANNVLDKGGETYRGISRKFNKHWYGWKYVDEVRNKKQNDVVEKANFWAQDYFLTIWVKENYDQIHNHRLAAYLFDYRINTNYCIKSVERILYKRGFKVTFDNKLDSSELLYLNLLDPDRLLKDISKVRINFYKRLVVKNPDQSVFLMHWLNRANLSTLNKAYG